MRKIRHLRKMFGELRAFARAYKVYWIVPLVILLLITAGIIVIGQGVAPFIYTLF
jgi:Family of unknown function (DUF5989)